MWRSTSATVVAILSVLALLLVSPRSGAEIGVQGAPRQSCLAAPCGVDGSVEEESAAEEDEELDCLDFSLLQTSLHLNRRSSAATRAGAEDAAVPESKPQAVAEIAADSSLSTKSLALVPSNAAMALTENIAVVEGASGERPKGPTILPRIESRGPTSSAAVGALERKPPEQATAASSAAAFAKVAATFAGLGIGAESGGGSAGGVAGSQWPSHEPHEGIVTGLLSTMAHTGMLRGLTAAFIFGLAFAISVVFFIQLLGIRSSEKARGVGGSGEEGRGRLSRSRTPSPGPLPPALRRLASQQQQQQQRLSALTAGGGGVGPWTEQQEFADIPPDELLILRVDSGAGHEVATGFSAASSSSSATARGDAICSALILGKAHFVVPMEAIRRLSAGQSPVEILGPSSRALLHARLPNFPLGGPNEPGGGDGAGGGALGRWLELTTTPKSRYPHACIGPLVLGSVSREPLQIRGPRSEYYGTLVLVRPGCWQAQRNHRAVLTLSLVPLPSGAASSGGAAPGQGSAFSGLRFGAESSAGSGLAIGAVATVALGGVDGQALEVKVVPGVDALLTLLCALAVLLMAPEQIRRGPSVEGAVCC